MNVTKKEFKSKIDEFLNLCDYKMEGYESLEKQRDLSVKFHWGHNHDFGDFQLSGLMGDRHLIIISTFIDEFKVLSTNLENKRILDVGCWTGGTSLLFAAMGAEVTAIEEVKKYADAVEYLKFAFNIHNLEILNTSLYNLDDAYYGYFDYIFFSGVLYHVTDMILALRIIFNLLKNNGHCLIESMALNSQNPYIEYYGPNRFSKGSQNELNRTGWNWFVPSPATLFQMLSDVGFRDIRMGEIIKSRIFCVAQREAYADMLRSGLKFRK